MKAMILFQKNVFIFKIEFKLQFHFPLDDLRRKDSSDVFKKEKQDRIFH
jgi:hypothetical protein